MYISQNTVLLKILISIQLKSYIARVFSDHVSYMIRDFSI